MRSVSYVYPVTVIREQFTPSLHVQRALTEFVDDDTIAFQMYATGHRIVDQQAYHQYDYDIAVKEAQRSLRTLGRGGIALSDHTRIITTTSGIQRLIIEPKQPRQLNELVSALDIIPSLEDVYPRPHHLYIDFAKNSLTQNVEKRRDALDMFRSQARHPSMGRFFLATLPNLVVRDIAAYPVHRKKSDPTEQ